MISLLAGLW
jgi:hypothetical protein